ncbi:MAG: hypothetical protein ACK48K_10545, partial [Planctomycetota bacterium]
HRQCRQIAAAARRRSPRCESNVRRRRTRGFWTVLTRLTVLTVLTADGVDEMDVVERVSGWICFDRICPNGAQ